ncbi:MAG: purine-nucleoside phosphorylase [Actinomycetia bacterium]|nr:purine-nucleoside phosphorylase [Actinomycetes bacterium]
MTLTERVSAAVEFLQPQLAEKPQTAVILGSGLGGLAELVSAPTAVDYADIPYFQISGAPGHVGRLLFGRVGAQPVACMQGRLHFYEGNTPEQIVFPLQVLQALGAQTLLVTNAAGGINMNFDVGDIMLITDHINFTGANPLTLGADQDLYDFPDMSKSYTPALRELTRQVAAAQNLPLREGVYLGVRGPNFETAAEIRAFRTLGADAVGMSTIFEVLAAVRAGMQILAFSLITNMATGILDQPLSGAEVIAIGAQSADKMERLIFEILQQM